MTLSSDQITIINQNWTNDDGTHDGGVATGVGFTISWQRGPINVAGRNGAFLIEVMEACHCQLEYFQNSGYSCEENTEALEYLDKAIQSLKSRRTRRESEGTFGTHQPDR